MLSMTVPSLKELPLTSLGLGAQDANNTSFHGDLALATLIKGKHLDVWQAVTGAPGFDAISGGLLLVACRAAACMCCVVPDALLWRRCNAVSSASRSALHQSFGFHSLCDGFHMAHDGISGPILVDPCISMMKWRLHGPEPGLAASPLQPSTV